ncbi:MAG: GTPase [Lachnospiraceae bacterium]|nr:GTPase [Lachnospiraceae bacterium]
MRKRKEDLPVYFFTGFLESGKTSFIKETLKDDQFKDGLKTLCIICEEGLEELTEEEMKENLFTVKYIEDEDDFNYDKMMEFDEEVDPDRVVIEFNGTWDPAMALDVCPEHWMLAEGIATVDASTYEAYLANMKQMMTRQFTYADLVLFNRCEDSMDLPMFKRTVRAINRASQVIFEMKDGTINNNVKEELPYDINASEIVIEDDDFGIWYLDTFDNLDAYLGKTVKFKAMVHKPKTPKMDVFVPGRYAMTCCAEDIQFVGLPCKWKDSRKLKEKQYVYVTATIGKVMNRQYGQETPVLTASRVDRADPAKEEVVYFQ